MRSSSALSAKSSPSGTKEGLEPEVPEDHYFGFLFPGQGSQTVGMCQELFQTSSSARALFQEADDTLGFSLSRLCFEGPEEELRKTINAQPAILTASLACLQAIAERNSNFPHLPRFVAGHSLGEYTALVAAGALEFPVALRLVRERGKLMELASDQRPGGMAAIIGLDESALEELCQLAGAELGNINTPEQIVISGSRDALARTIDLARIRGAKRAIPLEVSGAFHSMLMEPVRRGLQEAVAQVPFEDPKIPIVANTTALPLTTAQGVKQELLQQVCQCVRWQRSVEYMVHAGVSTFLEIGPGHVLSSLVKRISSDVKTYSIADTSAIENLKL